MQMRGSRERDLGYLLNCDLEPCIHSHPPTIQPYSTTIHPSVLAQALPPHLIVVVLLERPSSHVLGLASSYIDILEQVLGGWVWDWHLLGLSDLGVD